MKKSSPFLKKAAGPKPPNRRQLKRGLGSGLDNLLGAAPSGETPAEKLQPQAGSAAAIAAAASIPAAPESAQDKAILEIPPLDIERSPWQPRTEFPAESLAELSESMRANGVIQPVICRRRADGKLELICGERRLRAAIGAGLKKIPVVVRDVDDATAAVMGVAENANREDLNPIDEAEGYHLLQERFSLTQAEISERVGKSRPAIANSTRLLELPEEVRELVRRRVLSTGHAKVLLGVESERDRIMLARDCVSSALSVRALERRIAQKNQQQAPRREIRPDIPESHLRKLTDALRNTFGCAVRLTSGATCANGKRIKGVLEIDFMGNGDLDRILSVIGIRLD